ncbi:MAG: RNA polymerase factor sigma-54, partial [Thiohalocapsa sp.]
LQLSTIELAEVIATEIEQNTRLEPGERDVDAPPASDGDRLKGSVEAAPPALPEALSEAHEGDIAGDAADYWCDAGGEDGDGSIDRGGDIQPWQTRGGGSGFNDDDMRGVELAAARPQTLREHLIGQIGADLPDIGDRAIAFYLLDQLDEAGYLRAELDDAAARLGCPRERAERVLARLQEFDPPGVFARDLAECLALQLRDRDRLDPAMQKLLANLPLLAARNVPALIRICGIDHEDLADMVAEIKSLDPRPGHAFDPPLAQPVVPDIIMRPQPQGDWLIELNADTLPRVLVNHRYYARISGGARSKTERDYLSERLQAANWLVRSLHQRATTILKVAGEIVRQQDGFFRHGVHALRPLILRDIADAIGMHESTVSRVTSNKYIATPRGLFELKYFFTSSIGASRGGESHSAESVRFRIRGLIDGEASHDTLSDERIVELLQQEGVDIARRTVAKYREAMRIPSSVQRRREKTLAL